ncbi:MAG: GTPase HflX [Myxococcales bacterium]|nr:GTPase HflX [Myxococcales bacterium]
MRSKRRSANAVEGANIHDVVGNSTGLKHSELRALERLYRRRQSPDELASAELLRRMTELSAEIGREVGVLLDRRGTVEWVLVGDAHSIQLPDIGRFRAAPGRLRGLRFIRTRLRDAPLTNEDLTDLALLRLDMIAAVGVGPEGLPGDVYIAHLLPDPNAKPPWRLIGPTNPHKLDLNPLALVQELEGEMARATGARAIESKNRALLLSTTEEDTESAAERIEELRALAATAGVEVVGTVVQAGRVPHPKYMMGPGRLREAVIEALRRGCDLLVFDQDLAPSQLRNVTDFTELKVLDRTQLILDIFAHRATTREAKIRVELAQLRYMLPRLVEKNTAMSRLAGGIGGQGPGETKLEINRRRARERIQRLRKLLDDASTGRELRRRQRRRAGVPILSIVGYTNAGKSTLLNALTQSEVLAENRLFATLETASRRLRFPREREVIITDTVGFIRRLPPDLLDAFRGTLEELHDAHVLLHVVDVSAPNYLEQMDEVERTLSELDLASKPRLNVFNKADRAEPGMVPAALARHGGVAVSALDPASFAPLLEALDKLIWGGETRDFGERAGDRGSDALSE